MREYLGFLVATVALAAGPALAQRDFSAVEIKSTEVAPGLFILEGAGGNMGLSIGSDGAFLIDDQFAPLSEKIRVAIEKLSPQPVEFVLNTHWHGDHTGGNEAFSGAGARIVAHENVRARLKQGLNRAANATPPAPAKALPVITFSDTIDFYWNGHEIHVRHPSPAHTDGDAIVYFADLNVVHMGDVFFNGSYPFIDLESGGDLDGYIAAIDAVLAMIDEETRIIPGHGPLANKTDLEASAAMLKEVRARVQTLIESGLGEDAVIAADPLKNLNPKWGGGFINGEAMTRTAYKALTRG